MFNRKEWHKNYYIKHKEHLSELHKIWLESKKEYKKKWYEKNPGYNKQYYQKHQEKALEKAKEWQEQNPEKRKEIGRKYHYKHINELKFNLNFKMRRDIGMSLKGNKAGRHWEDIVGYTLSDLIKRLKKTMPSMYMWRDFLKGKLHIDHIIPIRAFVFNRPEDKDFKQCWSLYNLRLLPKEENLKKCDSIQNPVLLGLLIKYKGGARPCAN